MALKLFGYWRSSASYRVRIALNLKALEYEYVPVHLVKDGGEQHQADYVSLNPAKLVPTLIDDSQGLVLNQSMAIIEYLDDCYSEPKLMPDSSLDKAKVRTLAYDVGCDIQPIANLRVLKHLSTQFDADQDDKAAWSRHWIDLGFRALETRLDECAGDFCFANKVSLADIVLIPQVYNAQRFGLDLAEYPHINRIQQNCAKLDAFERARPENQPDAN